MNSPLLRDYFANGSIFILLLLGMMFAFLTLAPIAGFIPYSSNAGWHFDYFEMSGDDLWENAAFIAGWIRITFLYAVIVFSVVFGVVRFMESKQMDSTNIAFTSGILCAFLSGFAIHVSGWHILIHVSGVILGFTVGLIFGCFILPKQRLTYAMMKQ